MQNIEVSIHFTYGIFTPNPKVSWWLFLFEILYFTMVLDEYDFRSSLHWFLANWVRSSNVFLRMCFRMCFHECECCFWIYNSKSNLTTLLTFSFSENFNINHKYECCVWTFNSKSNLSTQLIVSLLETFRDEN